MRQNAGRALKGRPGRPKWNAGNDYPSPLDLMLLLLVAAIAAALLFGG